MKPSEEPRDVAYEIQCPSCQASPQEPCVTVFNRQPRPDPHETRKLIARERSHAA